ncbi:hypothetical protein Ancab_004753 [Ancistrocladus abbreviatus]
MAEKGEFIHDQPAEAEATSDKMKPNNVNDHEFIDEDEGNFILINCNNDITAAASGWPNGIEELDDHHNSPGSFLWAPLTTIREASDIESSVFSYDIHNDMAIGDQRDAVYVVVGKDESSSMDALSWTLNNLITTYSSTLQIYLIHVFPQVKFIPNPLGSGKVPKNQVRPEQVEYYVTQERGKRRELLQRFIDKCTSYKVKADTVLIESDDAAKAVVELLFVLNIRKLVIGISKSNLRKLRIGKGNGTANQILQNAPHWCEIKCIYEGKDALDDQEMVMFVGTPSSRRNSGDSNGLLSPKAAVTSTMTARQAEDQHSRENSFAYCCFKSNSVNE